MDAISYLMNRSWAPARKWSLILLGYTLLSWINWKIVGAVPEMFPHLLANGWSTLLWNFFQFLVGLTAFATFFGLAILAPIYPIHRAADNLQSWMRQRAVEEMVCAGLTGRDVVDRMVLFAGRWWLLVAAPTAVLAMALLGVPADWVLRGVGVYLLGWLAVAYFGLYITAWTGSAGGTIKMPLLASMTIVLGVPSAAMMAAGFSGASLLGATVYLIVTSRYATIHAVENAQGLEQMDTRFRRTMRMKTRGPRGALAENPILARETVRGADSSELFFRLMMALGFVFSVLLTLAYGQPNVLVEFLVAVTLISCYRAASKMSQIVTEEIESGTLETIRSTPMNSQSFLLGWMRIVVRKHWFDLSVLSLGTALGTGMLEGFESLADGRIFIVFGLTLLLPPLGALLGASVAGLGRVRRESGVQLLLPIGAFALFCLPELSRPMTQDQVAQYLLGLLMVTALLGWLLSEGAKKSLNRVFLPQK